mmetsp:Transcript_29136/g.28198  ORF Transcript_29136/g.28198 Transcript_29136/m.28198 type:complete len:86 (-) Transcript_29136:2046-2303(-)
MAVLTTAIESNTFVRISWDNPADNSEAITKYKIVIKQSDGTYSEDLTNCNGATIPVAQEYCDVPMATLWAAPFSLPYGTLIQVKA